MGHLLRRRFRIGVTKGASETEGTEVPGYWLRPLSRAEISRYRAYAAVDALDFRIKQAPNIIKKTGKYGTKGKNGV